MAHHLALSSAALLLVGGGAAYCKAKSIPSLVGSACLASTFLTSAYLFTQTDHLQGASVVGALGGAATAALGYKRYSVAAKKTVPKFLMALGAVNALYYTFRLLSPETTFSGVVGMAQEKLGKQGAS